MKFYFGDIQNDSGLHDDDDDAFNLQLGMHVCVYVCVGGCFCVSSMALQPSHNPQVQFVWSKSFSWINGMNRSIVERVHRNSGCMRSKVRDLKQSNALSDIFKHSAWDIDDIGTSQHYRENHHQSCAHSVFLFFERIHIQAKHTFD